MRKELMIKEWLFKKDSVLLEKPRKRITVVGAKKEDRSQSIIV